MPTDRRMDTVWRGPAVEYYTARTKNPCLTHLRFAKQAGPKRDTLCDSLNGKCETGQN